MNFEWDEGNLAKLELVRESGRLFYRDEIKSVFDDASQLITQTYSDELTGESGT
ncbi:hypothetical protein [Spirosoma koreense]